MGALTFLCLFFIHFYSFLIQLRYQFKLSMSFSLNHQYLPLDPFFFFQMCHENTSQAFVYVYAKLSVLFFSGKEITCSCFRLKNGKFVVKQPILGVLPNFVKFSGYFCLILLSDHRHQEKHEENRCLCSAYWWPSFPQYSWVPLLYNYKSNMSWWIRVWTHKMHIISRPCGWFMDSQLWAFLRILPEL